MRSPLLPPVGFGPGSQPDAEDGADLAYLPMPSGMSSFEPRVPWGADAAALAEGLPVLRRIRDLADEWRPGRVASLDLMEVGTAGRSLLDETLGEGEVSIVVEGSPRIEIQESVFAGIWRVRRRDADGTVTSDRVEVAPIPSAVAARTFAGALPTTVPEGRLAAPGVVNAGPILTELAHAVETRAPDAEALVVNLTLLPHTPEDLDCLAAVLGTGPTRVLSRGYGNCRIDSTRWPRVWRVRFYNSMDTLILDTIEVVAVPTVSLAAGEDIRDSAGRIGEVLEALS